MRRTKSIFSKLVLLCLITVMAASSFVSTSALEGCPHEYELNEFTGLMTCGICMDYCPHDEWSGEKCSACGITCSHDWSYASDTSLCRVCGKTCSSHSKLGLDFLCAVCKKDMGASDSINVGGNVVSDDGKLIETSHSVHFNFDFTVGTKSTVVNVKNDARNDNVFYDANQGSSDYYSIFTNIRNGNNYQIFASLWIDRDANKLYLVKAADSNVKICEILPGYAYNFDVVLEVASGKIRLEIRRDGELVGKLSSAISGLSSSLSSSVIRFGEAYTAKRARIQMIKFDNIIVEKGYFNGVCMYCGGECEHLFNPGGHCGVCGVYADPITFNDGSNGGGNIVHTGNNGATLSKNGKYYSSTGYNQVWDYRDLDGILLGRNYVVSARFVFNEYVYDASSPNGETALIIFSDADVKADFRKFVVTLYADHGKLEMGVDNSERLELELGKEYDVRVAVRSAPSLLAGTYDNDVEVSVNGKLLGISSFKLTEEDGCAIRIGDHVKRKAKVKYDILNDLGIHFINSDINYIGVQGKEDADYNNDSTFDLRFVFGIDDLYLDDVGFNVDTEVIGGGLDESNGTKVVSANSRVLTGINENGNIGKPGVDGAGYGGYYLALVVEGIELDRLSTYKFNITPYVKKNLVEGKKFFNYSYLITVTFDGDKMNIESEKINNGTTLSYNGLDVIVGQVESTYKTVGVKEDAYVEAGTSRYNNYGSAELLDLKALSGSANEYYRRTYLKFDISGVSTTDLENAIIAINCVTMENTSIPTAVNVYSCSNDWKESSISYSKKVSLGFLGSFDMNNCPKAQSLITSAEVGGTGTFYIDLGDYIKNCVEKGTTEVSFILEGDTDVCRRLRFASKENSLGGAELKLFYGGFEYTTDLEYTAENPWQVAMDNVQAWFARWEKIKAHGTNTAETITMLDSEYTLNVDAASAANTNGDSTKYTSYATRLMSTLQGYEASTAETAKYDVYGGLMDESLKQEATGYFYTKKIGDRWWNIDPLGYPYYRVACVTISTGSPNQKAALLAKHGTVAAWAQSTTDRLKELGFNSAGGWSDITNLNKVNAPISQTNILYLMSKYTSDLDLNISSGGNTELLGDVIPAFDPSFERYAFRLAASSVSSYVKDSNVYGWMSDNELPSAKNMLDNALSLDYTDERFIYTYATAWTFMYLKTGDVHVSVADVTDELRVEFRAMVYDKYFDVVTRALDNCDPNHMYIGCRFINSCYKDEAVMRVAGYYCDVVTFNYYSAWTPDPVLIKNIQNWTNKPFVITEWYAKGMDVCTEESKLTNKSGAGWTVRTQDDRGKFYQNYALMLLECKGCVGFDWFKYWDNDPDDKTADLSNIDANKGIYANDYSEYTALTEYMQELNLQKYNLIEFFDER